MPLLLQDQSGEIEGEELLAFLKDIIERRGLVCILEIKLANRNLEIKKSLLAQ